MRGERPDIAATTDRAPSRAAAFTVVRPNALFPAVLTCEHASNRLPAGGRLDADERRILDSHWGWDIGAWSFTRGLAGELRTSAIGARWSRLWIDLNRRVDDPDLVRDRAGGLALSWNRRLSTGERERRVLEVHARYHEAIDRLIIRRLVRGSRPLLFAVHSFTPRLDGAPRRRFDAGVLFERDREPARLLAGRLRDAGLGVRYNAPYSGMAGMMYSVDRHGKHHGLPCLELELNQALFDRGAVPAGLTRVVADAIREIVDRTGS
jgi:predicted N-formylglutamate amidohydrolase